ncbi:hypothetical protein FACS1894168_1640 [Deltaproteobacteria bacterium]|nr:hypothetical protein FACS1894168_1640 [Deltaproteobacteria bacterium]
MISFWSRARIGVVVERVKRSLIRFFMPPLAFVGRFLGLHSPFRQTFIKLNNAFFLQNNSQFSPEHILILLPHCLQRSACPHRLIHDLANCRRCGLCPVGNLLNLRDAYGVQLAIASGGGLARRLVKEKKPRLVLAVACERDLASGIADTFPLPVYGILNERPNGPCFDTLVSLTLVEDALKHFISA